MHEIHYGIKTAPSSVGVEKSYIVRAFAIPYHEDKRLLFYLSVLEAVAHSYQKFPVQDGGRVAVTNESALAFLQ